MKELTIEQKAKAYDEAIKRAEAVIKVAQNQKEIYDCVTTILPELSENEDERIRKALISGMNALKENQRSETFATIPIEDCIAWLEKQGEKKPYGQRKECEDCQFNYAGECKGYCQIKRDEQEPADKVEPKFHEGEWIVHGDNILKIKCVGNTYYCYETVDGYVDDMLVSEIDSQFHLWSIADAKDGNVLAAHECFVLFKKLNGLNIKCYCTYHYMNNPSFYVDTLQNKDAFHPATKEQRDTLIKAMANAGYTFDFEKKELKKIEPKALNSNKVIEWLRQNTCAACFDEPDEGVSQRIDKFKTDFELW